VTEQTDGPGVKQWPHAPVHQLTPDGVYMVTAATLHKEHLFKTRETLTLLEDTLLSLSRKYDWQLEAWAVFANHYHLVVRGLPGSDDLGKLLKHLHADTARELNRVHNAPGRQVWFNFWETRLTYERSYCARLNYVHQTLSGMALSRLPINIGGVRPHGSSGRLRRRSSKQYTRSR